VAVTELAVPFAQRYGRLLRYAAGSVVATVCSEVALIAAYGLFGADAQAATVVGWVAGAIPNYVLNQRWAWRDRGRSDKPLTEAAWYWGVTAVTATLAILATSGVDDVVRGQVTDRGDMAVLLGGVYLAVYGVVFVVKYIIFDRWVFGRDQEQAHSSQCDAG
jgi:putative flippase GtrA